MIMDRRFHKKFKIPDTFLFMNFTRTTNLRILKISLGAIVLIIITIYAISRSMNYARGPKIDLVGPINNSYVASTTVSFKGMVERAHDLTINGMVIPIDEKGNFEDKIIIFPGINTITLEAKDQFGRNTKTQITLVGAQK